MSRSLLVLLVLASACSTNRATPDANSQGAEGQPCYPNGTCNEGLSCIADLCESAPDGGKQDTTAPPDSEADAKPDGSCSTNEQCDDSLACTDDICGADGSCSNFVKGGWCLIDNGCFESGVNPTNECQRCDPATSDHSWTNDDGTSCDDGVACTYSDGCIAGVCQGIPYVCDAGLSCTTEECTGLGPAPDGCSFVLHPGFCLIDGQCFLDGETHPTVSCKQCDPASSSTSWTGCGGDACLNPADNLLLDTEAKRNDVEDEARKQTLSCLASDPNALQLCATNKLVAATGLSEGCASCYVEIVVCMVQDCLAECLPPDSDACTTCQNDKCNGTFSTCAGP